jgi:putative ABC transport system ATP-binding protein
MNAVENVAFPLVIDGRRDASARATQLLESVGLGHRISHRPSQLSGGEQQRVAIARALVAKPAVLLADEPTGSLDAKSGNQVLALLRHTADAGQAIVVATHDQAAASIADRVLTLRDGQLSL